MATAPATGAGPTKKGAPPVGTDRVLPVITMMAGILVAASAVTHAHIGKIEFNLHTVTLGFFAGVPFTVIGMALRRWSASRIVGDTLVRSVTNAVENWEKETLR